MTVPLALIAGIPQGVFQRASGPPCHNGWRIQTIPSKSSNKCDFVRIAKRVLNVANEQETVADGVHLLIAHSGSRKQINQDLSAKCYRVVWLRPDFAQTYGTPRFAQVLRRLLDFERTWREKIRPNIDSPLLLPEGQFATRPDAKDVWKRTYRVCEEQDQLDDVARMISRFRKHHRRSEGWQDTRGLLFSQGPHHGGSDLPLWRRRKFTFRLPQGHHFDVSHEKARSFILEDADGHSVHYRQHANVDAYGYARGGK